MANKLYTELAAQVTTLIREYGKQFQIRGLGAYDANTLTTPSGASRTAYGVGGESVEFNTITAQILMSETLQGWMDSEVIYFEPSAAIAPKEEVLLDGVWVQVAYVSTIKPADTVLAYVARLIK